MSIISPASKILFEFLQLRLSQWEVRSRRAGWSSLRVHTSDANQQSLHTRVCVHVLYRVYARKQANHDPLLIWARKIWHDVSSAVTGEENAVKHEFCVSEKRRKNQCLNLKPETQKSQKLWSIFTQTLKRKTKRQRYTHQISNSATTVLTSFSDIQKPGFLGDLVVQSTKQREACTKDGAQKMDASKLRLQFLKPTTHDNKKYINNTRTDR